MSRLEELEGEDEDFPGQAGLWDRSIANALRGRRGQMVLRKLERALLLMPVPERRLISGRLVTGGESCALGALAVQDGIDHGEALDEAQARLEYQDEGDLRATIEMGETLGLPRALACAIAWQNDHGCGWRASPEQRWQKVLNWVRANLGGGLGLLE